MPDDFTCLEGWKVTVVEDIAVSELLPRSNDIECLFLWSFSELHGHTNVLQMKLVCKPWFMFTTGLSVELELFVMIEN